MKEGQSIRGGYIGLLSLLITVGLIAFLVWRSDLVGVGNKQQNVLEQDQSIVKNTEALRAKLEGQGRATNEQLQ